MNAVHLLSVFAAILFATLTSPATLPAQTTAEPVHVRVWKTGLQNLARVQVAFKTSAGKHVAVHDLGDGGPGYQFNSYTDTTSGKGTLEVYIGAEKTPQVSQAVDFAPGTYITVLLSEPEKTGAPPRLEVIEDHKAAHRAQLTVRSFVGNLKEMQVTVGDSLRAQFDAGDGFLQMRGLKATGYTIHTTGTSMDGKPFEWTNETDLRQHSYQTLLVYPDPYGRIRPRLIVDGETQAEPPDSGEGQR